MKHSTFQRFLALLLCFAMLLPNLTGLASAAGTGSTGAPQSVTPDKEWVHAADPFASGEIPKFTTVGSVSDTLLCDGGNGMVLSRSDENKASSYMRIVTNTNALEAAVFASALIDAGFKRTAYRAAQSSTNGQNTFYRFLSPKGDYVLVVCHIASYKETRLIVDTAEDIVNDFAGGFVYKSTTGEVAQPMIAMYGQSMSPNGYDNTTTTDYNTGARNCGALIVIRMPDNSLFINDGGDIEQWSDEVCADFMKFCRELTGKKEGETVVINTWFISHAHSDHFDGLPRFIYKYYDAIDIRNVMYNIDDECLISARDMSMVLQMVKGYFPNVNYYKPHTGDFFDIAGVEFEVLYTQEDRFLPDANGHLDTGRVASKYRPDGTYRECLIDYDAMENEGLDYPLYDFNDTSAVLKVNFPADITAAAEDTSMILYADVNFADEIIMQMWPASALATDIMMVPHHGHDPHPELVAMSGASIFLYTQAKSAIYGPNGKVDYKVNADGTITYSKVDPAGTYRPALVNNFLLMHDIEGEKYFDTTANRKTYWEGTETACILFGENTEFENQPSGLTRDSQDPTGYTVYTAAVQYFPYGGWTSTPVIDPAYTTTNKSVSTTTSKIRLEQVTDGTLTMGEKYVIVHDKSDNILMYDPIPLISTQERANPPYSMQVTVGNTGDSDAYFSADEKTLYLSHSDRNEAMWLMERQEGTDPTIYTTSSSNKPILGGNATYRRYLYHKGLTTQDAYWTATDASSVIFRRLQPNSANVILSTTETANYNTYTEFFDDGTCVIYYVNSFNTKDITTIRFLVRNEDGTWAQKSYTCTAGKWSTLKNTVLADLDDLKLRLYKYEEQSTKENLSVTGPSSVNALQGAAQDALLYEVAGTLTVKDSAGLAVPYSGTEKVVGSYYMVYDEATSKATAYYYNDDATSTALATVTVNQRSSINLYAEYSDDDTTHAGTKYGSKYGFLYLGSNTIYEEVVNHTNLMDMMVTRLESDASGNITMKAQNVPLTPAMLTYANGQAVDFSTPGVYSGLVLNYNGDVVDIGFTVQVAGSVNDLRTPAEGEEGHVDAGKQSTTTHEQFLQSGVANIELSANGIPVTKGIDLIIVMDLSGSMKNGLDTNTDAPNYEDSRLYALEESLRSVIENLRSSGADIRIAMSDFGDIDHFEFDGAAMIEEFRDRAFYDVNMNNDLNRAYEFYNHLNFVITRDENGVVDQGAGPYGVIDKKFNLAHCSYTGRVVPTVYTGSGMVGADAFVDIGDLNDAVMNGIVAKMDENLTKSLGTNYDIGLEYAYQLGYSITKANESAGEDRELVCIFMSDGAAMQYNYFSGNGQSTGWEEWLTGEIDDVQSVADHYADEENWPEELEEISRVLLELLVAETVDKNYANGPYSQLQTYNYRSRSSQEYFRFYTDKVQEGYNYQYFFTYMDHQQYQLDWDFLQRLAKANGISDLVYDGSGYSYTYNGQSYVHDRVLQPLIDLFTDKSGGLQQTTDENPRSFYVSKLVNPDYRDGCRENNQTEDRLLVSQPKFYKQYTGTVDDSVSYTKQFFAAMESIGVEMNWDEFAKIAWKNTDELEAALDPDNTDGMNTTALRQLIASAKTPLGTENGVWQTLSPYDYFYNTEGKSWWAEALKGDADKLYPVINKYAHADNAQWNNAYYGDVRNHFTTGTGLELDGQDYISGFRGLDMELYTVSFSVADDNNLKADTAEQVLKNIASGPSYFFAANTREDLTGSLETIISSMDRAAGSAFYVDTMGEYFDLSTEKIVTVNDGSQVIVNADPSIRVLQYELDANGNRLPNAVVREKVTFEDMDGDGDTDAWSNMVYTTVTQDGVITQVYKDIWNENTGIISARYFYYNANTAGTNKDLNGDGVLDVNAGDVVDGVYKLDITGDGVGDYRLAPETFFWIIGVIGSDELVLEYQVYLTGSFDNLERLGGTYATNASATLTYTNYLGMTYTSQSPTSPVQEWGQAKIGYAYYLVNADGQPITADGTVTNINGAQKITSPVVRDLEWNHRTSIAAKTNFREVPAGYKLYAPDAEYLLRANSTGNGYWMIQQDATGTTYVQYPDAVYNNGTSNNTMTNGEYGDTIVWFAVKVADGGLTLDKTVEQTGEYYTLTLDAFANDMKLDDGDVLKEVLSDYFDLVGGVNADIKVYTARFNADGTTGTPVLFEGAKVTVGKTDESADRYDLISVSGFDYGQEYYYSLPRIKDGQEYYGSKLIVKVPVQVREGFWGGNNVPTNEDTTAVYDVTYSGSVVVGEEPVSYFPIPHVNVPVLPVIQAQDQVVYYGETGITGADLLTGGISVGGVAVSNDLKPAESWMDDYATLTWASGSATAQTVISGTASSDNRFTLVLKPTDAAAAEVGEKVPAEGYTVSDTGSVKVLVPVLTFRDSMILHGKQTDSEYYNTTNYLGDHFVKWVDMDNALGADGKTTDDLSDDVTLGEKPAITLSYTPEGGFNEDTPVDVTVRIDGVVANGVSWFDWQSCVNTLHDEEKISLHKADADQVDFWIHVSSIENDPDGLITDKHVTPVSGTKDQFLLTLEAYATGTAVTKPADIVLVIDHSASMHTPAGAQGIVNNKSQYTGEGQITKAELDLQLATHKGYYVAQSTATGNWFIIQYEPNASANMQWVLYQVTDTEKVVNKTEAEGWMEQTQIQHYSYAGLPAALKYYKSQFGVLYDSVQSFVQGLRESEVAHNVAIVGFAGYDNAGTRLYVGGDESAYKTYQSQLYHKNTTQERRNELYQKAMKNVAVESEYNELLELIETIDPNYGFTSPASGLQLANEVLAANPVNSATRDRIVVLFTDGIPNRAYGQGMYEDTYTKDQIFEQVVNIASTTKKTYGAKVFAISTATMGGGEHDRDFLHYLSSDYPNATSMSSVGAPIADAPLYTIEADKSEDLSQAFNSISEEMTNSKVSLDGTTLLVEVLSKYFDFLNQGANVNGTYPDVRIYTQKYLGQGTWGPKEAATHVNLDVTSTPDSEGRKNKVEVSGFDYAAEYISDTARTVNGTAYYGSKLVVEVDIKTREGFWGGDGVATNDAATGLYPPDSDVPVDTFPVPETNVPLDVQIDVEAANKTVYFGSKPLTPADLLKITAGGVNVLVTPEGFQPVEDWMDDFVTIDWTPNSGNTDFNSSISSTQEGKYPFSVTLTNKESGKTVVDTAESTVKILVPVYTFNDTTVPMGHIPVLNEENLTSGPIWVDLNTGLPGVASDPDSAPTMELVYNTTGAILEETPVQVTVNCTNPDGSKVDIMDAVTFHWVACHDSKHHSDSENVATHPGSANSIEFTIHVGVAQEDSVVIDFGLSVDIKPLTNDTLADIKLVGVYAERPEDLTAPFAAEATGKYGVLRLESESAVRYTLSGGNAMQMRTADRFYCVIAYTLGGKTVYDCAQLSVIPATTIYYEDSFIDFSVVETDDLAGLKDKVTSGGWTDVYDEEPKDLNDAVQSEDRPGEGLNDVDPNSIYGYDSVYASMAQYSLGSAKKIHVFSRKDADGNQFVKTGRATFTFSGTGFDVISLTSNTSGTLMVRLYEVDENGVASDTIYKTLLVDTYYGYAYGDSDGDGDEEWYVDADAENALYQVPVMKVSDLPYGTYKAVISASYNKFFDHDQYGDSSYDFYLDAIRIYDPAKGDETAEGAHEQDGEGWPTYQELRDLLISAADADKLEDTAVNGAIFIDGKTGALSISDYRNYGPNNELYLMPGQSIAFDLNLDTVTANMAAVHMGIKSVGGLAKAQIYAVGQGEKLDLTVNSATDLFYDLTELNGCTVVISNVGGEADAILSLTNIKTTYHSDPSAVVMRSVFSMRRSSANAVLASLRNEEQLPTLTLRGASIALKDEVMYNVFFDVENAAGLELVEMGMLTWSSKPETVSVALADQVMPGVTYNSTTGWYKARSQGVPAKNLADDISMAVYAKLADGRYVYSPAVDYSAEKYAYAILASEDYDAVSKAMAVALLEYGAAAQNYFGYKTEDLMNADLTDEMRKYLDGYTTDSIMDPILADADKVEAFAATGGFSEMAASASFKGAFALKYYFRPANAVDENMTLYCWSEETYLSSEALTSENADRILTMDALAGGNYMAAYTDIAAKNMDDTVFVCAVYESDGIRYSTGVRPYSFGAYCRSGLTHESAEFRALAEATMIYCAAAKALFGVD